MPNRPSSPAKILRRFWTNVEKTPTCWLWKGVINDAGYGLFYVGMYKTMRAHRYSWELLNARTPKGMFVCHHCDNRACVRLSHLFLGTHKENMDDMRKKKRSNWGERNHFAKVTRDDIAEIKRLYAQGLYQKDIAVKYDLTQQHVSKILLNQTWKNLEAN